MESRLPKLKAEELRPTRDYLRDVCLLLSALQRQFVPEHPRDWHYGLETTMHGISTQALVINEQEVRCSLDLMRHKLCLPGVPPLLLSEHTTKQLAAEIKVWLRQQSPAAMLESVKLRGGTFNARQANKYAGSLWWFAWQFWQIQAQRASGVVSPILLYPHHFDLALTWFPHDDEQQLSIGWSSGDKTVSEPYVYFTVHPEPAQLHALPLPAGAYWQQTGFRGAVFPQAALTGSEDAATVFQDFGRLFQTSGLFLASE